MPLAPKRSTQITEDHALIDFCLTHRFKTKRALAAALDKTPTTVSGWGNRVPIPKGERRVLQMWKQEIEQGGSVGLTPPEDLTRVQTRLARVHARLGSEHALWVVCTAVIALFDSYTDGDRHPRREAM